MVKACLPKLTAEETNCLYGVDPTESVASESAEDMDMGLDLGAEEADDAPSAMVGRDGPTFAFA